MMTLPTKAQIISYAKSQWFFPSILGLLLVVFSLFSISGTSIGIYHGFLYGDASKDPALLLGKPRAVRSDEWLVTTQMAIAQEKNGFKEVNQNFTDGKDMSLVTDAPYIGWSAIFKPQNFSFFVLPFQNAFAFKWWLLLFSLLISAYVFFLKLLPGKILLSVFGAIIIGCSPFVFWWYQTSTIAVLTYGFLIMLVSMSIIDRTRWTIRDKKLTLIQSAAAKTAILAYLLVAFGLILYPPFQIPVAIVVAFFSLGYLLTKKAKLNRRAWIMTLWPFIAAIVLTVGICGVFLISKSSVIHAMTNTVYPGKRVIASGGYDVKRLLVSYLQPQLERDGRGDNYLLNQSEASSFIILPLFLLIPSIATVTWLYLKKRKIDWILLTLTLCLLIFFSDLFIGGIDIVTKLFFLQLVPHERLMIGLGLLATVLLIYLVKVYSEHVKVVHAMRPWAIVYSVSFFCISCWAGVQVSHMFPSFIASKGLIVILAAIVWGGLGLVFVHKPRTGLGIIAAFSLLSVIFIHPLYQGLGPIYNGDISKTIQSLSTKDDVWAGAQQITIENLPQMSGQKGVTGLAAYPSTNFWKRYSDQGSDGTYNRYAHTFLSSNDKSSLVLVGPDLFAISAGCERKIAEKITAIVSAAPLEGSCHKLVKTLKYPTMTLYFYHR